MYADDVVVFLKHKNINKLFELINLDLKNIASWYGSNQLAINIKKSNYIIFTKKITHGKIMEKINDSQLFLTINNVKLEIVEETKYLGLLIDSNLSWDSHIQSINTKINKQIGILYRIKNILPKRVRLTYYYANINSHFIYALPIWGTKL